jgi:hypothetical protein
MSNYQLSIIKKKILDNVTESNLNITKRDDIKYLHNLISKSISIDLLNHYGPAKVISVMSKVIIEKMKERIGKDSEDDIREYMINSLDDSDNKANSIYETNNQNINENNQGNSEILSNMDQISKKIDLGFYRHKYDIEYINLDTFWFIYDNIASNVTKFNLVTQYNFQGDILIKKPLSNVTRIRIMPFRIPHYVLNAPAFNRSPITATSEDYFVGDYMHVKTPATRIIGIEIEEIIDKIKTGINVDKGTTTVYNNPNYANIPNQFKTVKNSILADCIYETDTYDETFHCMTTLVTPRNDGYIYLQSSLNKLDSITISLNDTVSDIYLPSPSINCTHFVASGITQLLVTTETNGTALLPIGVEHRAYITDFKLDFDNIDETKLVTIDKPTFIKEYLLQYLNTRGVPVTVTRNGSSTNELLVNIIPPPYYTGTIYAKGNFKVSIINRRVLIPIQIEQLREEIKKS